MIYEFRTYDLVTRAVPEFEARTAAKIKEGRQNYSQLFGFWYTEVGPINQVIHVWPYEDLEQRRNIRAEGARRKGIWPPDNSEFIRKMRSEIFMPAPFMEEPRRKQHSARSMKCASTHTRPLKYPRSSRYGATTSRNARSTHHWSALGTPNSGALNTWIHMWAYESYDQSVRPSAKRRVQKASGRRPAGSRPLTQEEQAAAADELLAPSVGNSRSSRTGESFRAGPLGR